MAGAGQRFAEAGYTVPKPFIEVMGRPMIELVLDNLQAPNARFVLIAQKQHVSDYADFFTKLKEQFNASVVEIEGLTEGAACTVLRAVRQLNNDQPLLIANSDQLVDISMAEFMNHSQSNNKDGSILTFPCADPKWSYARTNSLGVVDLVAEKQAISSHATVGIYYWQRGQDFVEAAAEMISHNDRTNNEFYTAPAYNYAIAAGAKIGIYEIAEAQMHGLGTPEDLVVYLARQQQRVR